MTLPVIVVVKENSSIEETRSRYWETVISALAAAVSLAVFAFKSFSWKPGQKAQAGKRYG